jgi:hypothetical protein
MPWRDDQDEWGNPVPLPLDSVRGRAAWADYTAATRDMDPADRPAFSTDDWNTPAPGTVTGFEPTHPAWADDSQPDPICQCGVPGCAGAYGGRCQYARDPWEASY